jgi:hypothetical protein
MNMIFETICNGPLTLKETNLMHLIDKSLKLSRFSLYLNNIKRHPDIFNFSGNIMWVNGNADDELLLILIFTCENCCLFNK